MPKLRKQYIDKEITVRENYYGYKKTRAILKRYLCDEQIFDDDIHHYPTLQKLLVQALINSFSIGELRNFRKYGEHPEHKLNDLVEMIEDQLQQGLAEYHRATYPAPTYRD